MNYVSPSDGYDSLQRIAAHVCNISQIDFGSLQRQQAKGIVSFWCGTCRTIHPLTDLALYKRKKICAHCGSPIRLYASSNKFGKVRRIIFYRLLDLGLVRVIRDAERFE